MQRQEERGSQCSCKTSWLVSKGLAANEKEFEMRQGLPVHAAKSRDVRCSLESGKRKEREREKELLSVQPRHSKLLTK